ncbi:Glycosyl transferase, family 4, conserved region-containing protein [Flexistipes sinusarabici DSM 4947]|uniref:Glycosyl transferase, family 4, conserved region-containing protein n=2 Tax=Flexistipes sinusarabici TaxID=2352 RepID=F8E4C9_FLESM|nr:Glycosyl transferase, family 4, conserved region-containing protein [Flexistipes sinusarabici DSM 4947]
MLSFFLNFAFIYLFKSRKFKDTFDGPQKFHITPTPRIGGLAIILSVFAAALFYHFTISKTDIFYILVSSIPISAAGLAEDVFKKVTPRIRLLAAIVSVLTGSLLLDMILRSIDIPFLDFLFQVNLFAYLFTILAVAGVANSINIIDGYNGLSSVVSILILFALSYVSFELNDELIMIMSFVTIGAVGGFFIWNYPFGKIFLGDGGAYFIGFIIALLSILLVNRHSEVSAWFPLLLVIYPVFETVFSMYRRKILKKSKVEHPDSYHLHQLIYKRVIPFIFDVDRNNKLLRNSATSPFLWLICSFGVIPAVIFWEYTYVLMFFVLLFCILYIWLYKSIVKFQIGKYLK